MKREKGFRGDRLRKMRAASELSQEELAARLGIAQTQYSRYERNEADPSLPLLKLMCQELRVTADYLIGLKSDPT